MIQIINKSGLVNDTLVLNSQGEDITQDLSIKKLTIDFPLNEIVEATMTCLCSSVDVRVNRMHYEWNKQVFYDNKLKRVN